MTEYSGGKFRKKKVNFSMISNEIIRDDTVSLKSKGLYALIRSKSKEDKNFAPKQNERDCPMTILLRGKAKYPLKR